MCKQLNNTLNYFHLLRQHYKLVLLLLRVVNSVSRNSFALNAPRSDLNTSLHGLLQVFEEGKIPNCNAFCKSNSGKATLLQQFGLDAEVCQQHMHILSLCSLTSEHEEIPYSVIDETLKLKSSNAQVESWVIAAVGTGLLQAKMDQLRQTVMVECSAIRKFNMEQWKSIQTRLSSWKQNVGGVLAS